MQQYKQQNSRVHNTIYVYSTNKTKNGCTYTLFWSRDLNLDAMTLKYDLGLQILKLYLNGDGVVVYHCSVTR